MKKRLIFCAALFLAAVADTFACTNLIVGKNASTDGSTIVSYSADSYGLLENFITILLLHILKEPC